MTKPLKTVLKDLPAVGAWLDKAEARKAVTHPEHRRFVPTCQRCRDFRESLFRAN